MRNVALGLTLNSLLIGALTASCVTPQQKRQMDDDIYRLQTKVLELESSINQSKSTDQKVGEVNNRTIASTSSDVERIGIEVKRMKGDIDALKVGVQTGQMPGQEAPQEGSIAAQLTEIKSRLEAVESQQKELLQSLEKGSPSAKKTADKKPQGSKSADFESLKTAYDRKHFKEVAEDAPNVLKKAKGREREQTLMMYGESLMKLQRPKEAALQFNELVELKPGEKQLAVAKLRLGDAFKAMGDKDTSQLFYEEVATKYAGTAEGEKAKKALKAKK
jgi:TolA-binding protein